MPFTKVLDNVVFLEKISNFYCSDFKKIIKFSKINKTCQETIEYYSESMWAKIYT